MAFERNLGSLVFWWMPCWDRVLPRRDLFFGFHSKREARASGDSGFRLKGGRWRYQGIGMLSGTLKGQMRKLAGRG